MAFLSVNLSKGNIISAKFARDKFCYLGMLQTINIKQRHITFPGLSIVCERLHSPQWIPVDIKLTVLDSSGHLSKEILFITL